MRILSFTCKTMVFFVTVSAVFWAVPPQAADGKQEGKQFFGSLSEFTGDLACFTLNRNGKETKWLPPDFDGWFRFGDVITMRNQSNCDTSSITILLAGDQVTTVKKPMKLLKTPSGSPSEPMKVVLNDELEKLTTPRSGSGSGASKGEECNFNDTPSLFAVADGIKTISLLADKKGCPKSTSTEAQIVPLTSCEGNDSPMGDPIATLKPSPVSLGEEKWLVLEKKDSGAIKMETDKCYRLYITNGGLNPIKIKAVNDVTSVKKTATKICQWPLQ